MVVAENDELKKKVTDYETTFKRYSADNEQKVIQLTQELERMNRIVEQKNG